MDGFQWKIGPNFVGWVTTSVVCVVSVAFAIWSLATNEGVPKISDVGSYLSGVFAILAFVWLIVGHLSGQAQLREGQKELESQLSLTRDAVSSLVRLASSAQVHDAATLSAMLPEFIRLNSEAPPTSRHSASPQPRSWFVTTRNTGNGVKLFDATSRTDGVQVRLNYPGFCPRSEVFNLIFESEQPIRSNNRIECQVSFEDLIGRHGYANITVHTDSDHVSYDIRTGSRSA